MNAQEIYKEMKEHVLDDRANSIELKEFNAMPEKDKLEFLFLIMQSTIRLLRFHIEGNKK